jgi:uncharacterized membrane protein YeaQ/YmgE (transglycosylase-associated protein family)
MLIFLFWMAVAGLIVGALGRLVIPGPDPMGVGMTILVGIAGGLLAGLLANWLWGQRYGPGLILSVACAALIVYLMRRSRRGYA